MSPEQLISTYGYAAVGVGAFLEGETFLVLGGFAAHGGYLELSRVILCAYMATLFGDQLYFHVGRFKGADLLAKRPRWKSRTDKVFRILHRHQVWLILGFRFLYGLRIATPFVIGVSGISPFRFLMLDAVGALFWTVAITVLGYLFGYTLEALLGDVRNIEWLVFAVVAFIGIIVWIVHWRRR